MRPRRPALAGVRAAAAAVRGRGRDTTATAAAAVFFSIALSLSAVLLPLVALRVGYSPMAVGLLTAASGVSQFGTRLVIGPLMRRFSDWVLVLVAVLAIAGSTAVLLLSTALVPFLACQVLQGTARGAFWTGSQTHAVRRAGSSAAALAGVGVASSCGQLVGPLAGGLLAEISLNVALIVVTGIALLAIGPTCLLDRLPPFAPAPRRRGERRVWRRPAVTLGCWSSMTTGAWRGLMGSYVPVALVAAGQSGLAVGVLVWLANATCLVGVGAVGKLGPRGLARSLVPATVVCGLAVGLIAVAAAWTAVAAALLAVSGLGAGVLQVIGPARAVDAVDPEERGDAIAATGTFRAFAVLGSPLVAAGLLAVVSLGPAMLVVGATMLAPTLTAAALAGRRVRAAERAGSEGDGDPSSSIEPLAPVELDGRSGHP